MTLSAVSGQAATPTFSPAAGTYSSAQTVTISDTTSGAAIYYTTNGTTPTTSSSVYSSPITVSATETLEAIATATGYSQSAVGSAAYTITSSGAQITGSGTANTVPVFASSSSITNSPIAVSGSNVGIGTTAPITPLDVNGGIFISQPNQGFGAATLGNAPAAPGTNSWSIRANAHSNPYNGTPDSLGFEFWNGTNVIFPINFTSSGNVGIGTTAPSARLDVGDATGNGALETVFARLSEGNTTGDGTYLGVKGWNTQPSNALSFSIEHHFYGQTNSSINFYRGGSQGGGFITFATDTNNERMRIDPAGNVGIGTTSPAYNLDVAGVARAQSGIIFPDGNKQVTAWTGVLCGGDYAEAMNAVGAKKSYEPGDVLVLSADGKGAVAKAQEPYSTLVAGIYATKPGVIGRRASLLKDVDEVPMAMVGVVPTKVSAENGPIRLGDLLVTASNPGYAMKGTDRGRMLGAVIGKAMGSLDSGTGVIEVLVTLQ
jgi:hypothetical protein